MKKSAAKSGGMWKPEIGCWVTMPSHWACEMAAAIGYSVVFIDLEHGTINVETADRLIGHSRALGLTVFVRVASPDRVPIQQALDSGAHALILPQVRDFEHAEIGSRFTKYPKLGLRGMGTPRSLNYGSTPSRFVDSENRRTKCFVMVETSGALRDVRKIAALDTVDGLFMGPYDLSLTRGRGQYGATADDRKDAALIADAARAAGKLLGMPVGDRKGLAFARHLKANVISTCEDMSALNAGLTQAFNAVAARR